jgi:hypothetical protein
MDLEVGVDLRRQRPMKGSNVVTVMILVRAFAVAKDSLSVGKREARLISEQEDQSCLAKCRVTDTEVSTYQNFSSISHRFALSFVS